MTDQTQTILDMQTQIWRLAQDITVKDKQLDRAVDLIRKKDKEVERARRMELKHLGALKNAEKIIRELRAQQEHQIGAESE